MGSPGKHQEGWDPQHPHKSNWEPQVQKDTQTLRKSIPTGWSSADREVSNITTTNNLKSNKWETPHLWPEFSSLNSSFIYISQICGFLFPTAPKISKPRYNFHFSKVPVWFFTLSFTLLIIIFVLFAILFSEKHIKDLNNVQKVKWDIFPHHCCPIMPYPDFTTAQSTKRFCIFAQLKVIKPLWFGIRVWFLFFFY